MEVKTVKSRFNEIFLIPIGDIHIGERAFNEDSKNKLLGYIDWIKRTPNAYAILMGDLINCATTESASTPFSQNMDMKEQIETVVKYLTPIKHKIIGAITGNHEQRLERYCGYNPTISICDRLGCFYFGYDAVVIFRLGCHGRNTPRASFTGYFHHTTGGGGTIGGKMNRAEKLRDVVADADIYCVSGSTMIKTNDGVVPMKDIRMGDYVLTLEGDYQKVTKLYKRKADTIQIKTRGGFQNLIITENHPLYVQEMKRLRTSSSTKYIPIGHPIWKNAGNVKIGDFIGVASENITTKTTPTIMGKQIDKKLARFIGLYLAEGNTWKNGISISLNDDEVDLKDFVKNIAKSFETNITENLHKGTKSYQVTINSKRLMTYFLEFGKTAHSKRIPEKYYYMPNNLIKSMLDGLFDGDGYTKKHRKIMELATVSGELAYQVAFLLNRIGYNANVNKSRNSGKYTVSYSIMNKLVRRYSDGNRQFVECVGKSKFKKNMDVYNIGVEKSNTYTANGLVVHNCGAHNHMLGCVHTGIFRINQTTEKVEWLRQMIIDTGGYLNYEGSYANMKQLPPLKLGSPKIRMLVKRNTLRKDGKKKDIIKKDIHVSL